MQQHNKLEMAGSYRLETRICIMLLVWNILPISGAVSCNDRAITDACSINNNCSTGSGFLNEGIQLLIPSWNFPCLGAITEWRAHIQGNISMDNLIEFQIFEPDPSNTDTYNLVYGNEYKPSHGGTQSGSLITRPVDSLYRQYIPIAPGYIIGVYLPPNTADQVLELLYSASDEGDGGNVDTVYYWTNVQNRTCQYSLCTGNVLKNVSLLLEWDFLHNPINLLTSIVDQLKEKDPSYCQPGSVQDCDNPASTTTSSPSATPSPSVSMATTSIVKSSSSVNTINSQSSSDTAIQYSATDSDTMTITKTSLSSFITTTSTTISPLSLSSIYSSSPLPVHSVPISSPSASNSGSPTISTIDDMASPPVPTVPISSPAASDSGSPTASTIDDMASPPVPTVLISSPSATNSGSPSIDDMASPPSSSVGGYPSYLLTLFGAVLVLLFVIIILILVLILVVMVTSKRKKKTYPIEARNPNNDKMELELIIEDNKTNTGKLPATANGAPPHHHDDNTDNAKNGESPITNLTVKQQLDEDYSEIDDYPESSRKDYKSVNVGGGGEYCEPNVVFTSSNGRRGHITTKANDKDGFAVYETMYDDYDVPNNNRYKI